MIAEMLDFVHCNAYDIAIPIASLIGVILLSNIVMLDTVAKCINPSYYLSLKDKTIILFGKIPWTLAYLGATVGWIDISCSNGANDSLVTGVFILLSYGCGLLDAVAFIRQTHKSIRASIMLMGLVLITPPIYIGRYQIGACVGLGVYALWSLVNWCLMLTTLCTKLSDDDSVF